MIEDAYDLRVEAAARAAAAFDDNNFDTLSSVAKKHYLEREKHVLEVLSAVEDVRSRSEMRDIVTAIEMMLGRKS